MYTTVIYIILIFLRWLLLSDKIKYSLELRAKYFIICFWRFYFKLKKTFAKYAIIIFQYVDKKYVFICIKNFFLWIFRKTICRYFYSSSRT